MEKIAIIIVNYKGWNDLEHCLDSLAVIDSKTIHLEVIVVDNCSNDGKFEQFKTKYADFNFVLNTSNRKLFKLCRNKFPIINIGSRDIYSIKNLANLIKNKVGFKGNIFFDKRYPNGVAKKNLNYDRIKSLNWRPKINLTKGLDIILKYEKINL